MPYTKRQLRTAQAIAHGMKPTGKAKGFTRGFAEQVLTEVSKGVTTTKKVKRSY